jgi:large subunit ribosomal protein L29
MKMEELRGFNIADLDQKLKDMEEDLANMKIQLGTKQLKNTSRVRLVKKDIARVKTLLREYQLGISKPKVKSD